MTIEHSLVSHNLSLTSSEGSSDDGHVIHVIANWYRRTLAGRRAAAGVGGRQLFDGAAWQLERCRQWNVIHVVM